LRLRRHSGGQKQVGDEGLESIVATALPHNDLRDSQKQRDAKSDARYSPSELATQIDPALADIVDAWPLLSPAAKAAVTAMVSASLQSVMSTS